MAKYITKNTDDNVKLVELYVYEEGEVTVQVDGYDVIVFKEGTVELVSGVGNETGLPVDNNGYIKVKKV